MPRKSRPTTVVETWSPIEQEFLAALQRIQSGTVTDRGLAKKAKLGGLRVSIAAVAKEAGRSRTLIGHEDCRYPRVRQRIIAAMEPVVEPRTAQDVIGKLRDDNADLRAQLARARSQNAALVQRMAVVEAAAKREIRRAQRDAAEPKKQPSLQVAGRSFLSGEVVSMGLVRKEDKSPE